MKYIKNRINERFQINSDFGNLVLLRKDFSDNLHFMLYDTNKEKPIGYISAGYYESVDVFSVGGAYSEKGYGPFLYECIMTEVFPKGVSLSRDGSTSFDAVEVWEKFLIRSDVRSERMNSEETTHKKEELSEGGGFEEEDHEDDYTKELQRVIELEDTRFFYSFGRDKLDRILAIGDKYKLDHGITDDDIEHMSWDLE